ncbi:MAG TPA: DNA alkylation repair protein [Candidatus Woesebacteria bacterium]|nr:DNA alkylation repair protein [Candidatus Woesebacteria bacterium]
MSLSLLTTEINRLKNPTKAKVYQWFFKTGPGQYREGDVFLGVTNPHLRRLVKFYWDTITIKDIQELLNSPYHEYRLIALLIMVKQYPKNTQPIFNLYLANTKRINNWDLVDLSARDIVGAYCYEQKDSSTIKKLSQSTSLWEKRISMISTFYYLKNHHFDLSFEVINTLISDPHDLIHKAIGWTLREIGKKDLPVLLTFLDQHTLSLPRTALRYAIEKLPEPQRLYYLKLR